MLVHGILGLLATIVVGILAAALPPGFGKTVSQMMFFIFLPMTAVILGFATFPLKRGERS